jgi:hypothetical protein
VRAEATYEFFTSFSLPRRFALTFFAPYVLGGGDGRLFAEPYTGPPFYAEFIAYTGLLTLMLSLAALLLRHDARTTFWAAAAAVGFLLALGGHAPLGLYKLVSYVPVLNLFRVPARHLLEVDFALAVLAGRGVTALAEARADRGALRRAGLAAGLVFALTCIVVTVLRPDESAQAGAGCWSRARARRRSGSTRAGEGAARRCSSACWRLTCWCGGSRAAGARRAPAQTATTGANPRLSGRCASWRRATPPLTES